MFNIVGLLDTTLGGKGGAYAAAAAQQQAYQHGIDAQRRQALGTIATAIPEWNNVGDFWNDPRRWDGIDPHKTCFWTVERKGRPIWNVQTMEWVNR